jgi:hypothetical protein
MDTADIVAKKIEIGIKWKLPFELMISTSPAL